MWRLRDMTALDATGLHAIESLAKDLKEAGKVLILCGDNAQPARVIHNQNTESIIGKENITPHITAALQRAKAIYESSQQNSRETESSALLFFE